MKTQRYVISKQELPATAEQHFSSAPLIIIQSEGLRLRLHQRRLSVEYLSKMFEERSLHSAYQILDAIT